MKVSYFNYHYDIEGSSLGAANQIRALAAALTRLGHQVDVQFRTARPPGERRQYLGLKKIHALRRYGHVPRLIWRNFALIREELKLLDQFRPDVVLAVSSYANFSALAASRRRRLPLVLFAEAPLAYEYSLFYQQYYPYASLGRWIEALMVRKADQVVCISEILKGFLCCYGASAPRLHVVPNGVDQRLFKPLPPDPELQTRFALQGRSVVGFVGSFQFFCGTAEFARLARTVCDQHPQAVFFFVGQGEIDQELHRLAEVQGIGERFIFAGAVPHEEVPRYLSVMDLVISPYRGDYLFYGSSMKLLEYLAAGKPTIVPALGQIKEVVRDGENGMLYDPGDYAGLQRQLLQLLENPQRQRQLGVSARRTIEAGWTWDIQAARVAEVLKIAVRPDD